MPQSAVIENTLLVSTIPSSQITFYADDPQTHEQSIKIYNQYEFPVKFRILVAASDNSKYTVDVAQSHIRAQHYVEIKLTHKAVTAANIGVTDKIRVQLLVSSQCLTASGKKDLLVTLLPSCSDPATTPVLPEHFHQLQAAHPVTGALPSQLRQTPMAQNGNKDYLAVYHKIEWLQVFPAFFLGVAVTAYYFLFCYLSK